MSQEATTSSVNGGSSPVQTIMNVFLSPREAFEAVERKPNWVVPFVIILIVSLAATYFIAPVAMQERMESQREQLIEDRGMTPEEADQAMAMGAKIGRIAAPIMGLLGAGITIIAVAAVLLFLGNIIMGGDGNFKRVFSMYSYSSMIGVLGTIITTPFIISKQTVHMSVGLGALLTPVTEGAFMDKFVYQLLSKVELFTIWQLVVVSIGMAVVYKFTTKKAATGVVVVYIVYAIIASLIAAAF